jgi:uncharacterized protein YjbI with pentapeptide repeats
MANQEHLDILKQGINVWNKWRKEHRDVEPDLSEADLREVRLNHADLSGANLSKADLFLATLNHANLSYVNLSNGRLGNTNLYGIDLSNAKLIKASFSRAYLSNANLQNADLSGAILSAANISRSNLEGVNLTNAVLELTVFGSVDLSVVKGLDAVNHSRPSSIGIDTIYSSKGMIPEVFLSGAGVPHSFIEYARSLVVQPFDFYSCFISYSSKDLDFAECLYSDLQNKGVRCWFAPHDMKIGDKIRLRIEESIHHYDKLLLVLSEHSIKSDWVEKEVETAFEKERLIKECREVQTVLFPLRLDEAVMKTEQAWAADIRRTRHIGDFRHWKDHAEYQKAFIRLLRHLKAETRKVE